MNELRRMLDDSEQDELARALLRSAKEDEPNPRAVLGVAAALGVSSAFSDAMAAGATVAVASGLAAKPLGAAGSAGLSAAALKGVSPAIAALIAKHVGIGLVVGVFAMGGLTYAIERTEAASAPRDLASTPRSAPESVPVSHALSQRVVAPSEPVASLPEASTAQAESDAPAPVRRAVPNVALAPLAAAPAALDAHPVETETLPIAAYTAPPAPPFQAPSPEAGRAAELNRQLAEEVALLDRARVALRSKDPAGALRILDEYARAPRSGTLEPETMVLRIQALSDSGDGRAAARLARRFIQRYPESRHVPALRKQADDAR